MKTSFTALLEEFDDTLYKYHVKIPLDIYQSYVDAKIKRLLVTYNGSDVYHNAFLSKGGGIKYLKLNKETMKSLKLNIGDQIKVTIDEDKSKYGMPIAPEMTELLLQDVEGEEFFHKLSPGKIRSLLYKISSYKTSDKRIETSVIILEHLKANGGNLDWKMLNEAFKIGFKL